MHSWDKLVVAVVVVDIVEAVQKSFDWKTEHVEDSSMRLGVALRTVIEHVVPVAEPVPTDVLRQWLAGRAAVSW